MLTPRARPRGALTGALFVALTLLTALSIGWSVAPAESWIEANRTLAYLAVFLGAIALGNLGPGAGRFVLGALLVAASAVVAYALASRVWPGDLAELEFYARIGQPFGYWNAVGVTAAIAFPGAVWLGTRRTGATALNALAFPLAGVLVVALFLTYSRSALLGAVVALVLWLVFVPLRLRTAALAGVAAVAATPVLLWASGEPAFTEDAVELVVREDAGTTFGLLVLAMAVVLYAVGLGLVTARERVALGPQKRRAIGRILAAALAAAALAGVASVATSDRGLGGTLADRWEDLSDEEATTVGGPDRLGSTASSRSRYWGQAADVFAEEPLAGVGAGGFATAALRFREDSFISRHAHGYVVQTMADLGIAGLAISLALAFAWLASALSAVGATPRSRLAQLFLIGRVERVDHDLAPAWTADRLAVTALFLAALAYAIQSAIDWTWFVPGPTVMALVAAGFVAGRGPAPESAAPPEPAPRLRRGRLVPAGLAVLAALAATWSVWQPQRADSRADEALELAAAGDTAEAVEAARDAQAINPLSVKALFAEAVAHQRADRNEDAAAVFRRAVAEHPRDPQAWLRLADFELYELGRPRAALASLDQALYLDPMSRPARDSFVEARARLRATGELGPDE